MNQIKKTGHGIFLLTCFMGLVYTNPSIAHNSDKKGHDRQNWCPEAQLSKEQKNSIKEIHKNFRSQKEGLSEEERHAAKQALKQSILDTVLESDEQRIALSECWNKKNKWNRKGHDRRHRDKHGRQQN